MMMKSRNISAIKILAMNYNSLENNMAYSKGFILLHNAFEQQYYYI